MILALLNNEYVVIILINQELQYYYPKFSIYVHYFFLRMGFYSVFFSFWGVFSHDLDFYSFNIFLKIFHHQSIGQFELLVMVVLELLRLIFWRP